MSTLTKEQRAKLPAEDFGDPERRLFPIVDQDDVDSAAHLVGKAADPEAVKRRIISIATHKGLRLPDAWRGGKAEYRASFGGPARTDGECVIQRGKLWRAGR